MLRTFFMLSVLALALPAAAAAVPQHAESAAAYAVERYDAAQVELLADLVRFRTVHREGIANADNPEFKAFKSYLEERARAFGLDFTDLGAAVVIGLGDAPQRLGVVTHGDVQPADASKWAHSPFELDAETEPGRLIARGAEDNKSPIATAMYAMKALRELELPLTRRIELIIALTEESDWSAFEQLLETWTPPEMNVAIDSQYPVVVAEKGWGGVWLTFEENRPGPSNKPYVKSFDGGAFISQVPENARLVVAGVDDTFVARVQDRARDRDGVRYTLERSGDTLQIDVTGKAAHSSTPEQGRNALAHAAALLEGEQLLETAAGRAVDFVNARVGTGLYGERFGELAYSHPFMGPLSVNVSTVKTTAAGVELAINLRAPAGKSEERLEREVREAIASWADQRGVAQPAIRTDINAAYFPERPPQVEPLLAVFRHYTGMTDAEPISIGGGTHARLLPNAVNFGPSMPGVPYTAHSEHEFITREQLTLNLKMYTAMLAWLASESR